MAEMKNIEYINHINNNNATKCISIAYLNSSFVYLYGKGRQVSVRFILLYFYIPLHYGISLLFCLSNFLPCRVLVDFVTISPCIENFRNQTEATEKPTYERCVT